MKTLFVTGTGTGIGKTFIASRLLEVLAGTVPVRGVKPVITGFDPARPEQSDTAELLSAQGRSISAANIEAASPWRYRDAVSADIAARRERRPLPFSELIKFSRAPAGAGINLIEGVGGVMAPLDETHTVLDWIAALEPAVLLVTGSYLGSLSHTLSALAALASRGLTPVAIVVSQSETEPVPTAESVATLRNFIGAIPVLIVARDQRASAAELAALLQDLLSGK